MYTYTIKYLTDETDPIEKNFEYMDILAKNINQAIKIFKSIARHIEKNDNKKITKCFFV